MRHPVLYLLAFLIFASTSCRKGELIGREVQVGDNDILLNTTEDFHISAQTILAKRERTDERFEGMLGAYIDPIFGKNVISYISQYNLEKEGFDFGDPDSVVFDSAFVSFRLSGGYREKDLDSDLKSIMHFKVYELSEDLYLDSIYYSDRNVRIQPSLVGEFNGSVSLTDSIFIEGNPQPAQIRIKLSDGWGQKMISADPSVFETNEAFKIFMKGLMIQPIQTTQANSNGAVFYFYPYSGFTNVTIHYHNNSDTGTYSFITNNQTANYMQFEHDYDAAPVSAIFNDTATGSQTLYLQATIGTDVQLEMKDIVAKFGADPKIINYAELIIPVDSNQPYYPLNQLTLSRKLENGTAEFLPDQVQTGDRKIDGEYDADKHRYRFRITQYIQEIIQNYSSGDDKSEILLLSPFGNNITANRSVVLGPRPSDPSAEKLRIVITYTPLN